MHAAMVAQSTLRVRERKSYNCLRAELGSLLYVYLRAHADAHIRMRFPSHARNAHLNLSKHHRAADLFEALFELYMGSSC